MARDFLVNKKDLRQSRFVAAAEPQAVSLSAGEILLRIERFAFTSNNVTYAVFGEAMNYWQFFPVAAKDDGWGRIPVWGFATIEQLGPDAPQGLAPGERFYGYFPMSSHVVLKPVQVNATGFSDGAAHRASLSPVYNQYRRCSADASYRPDNEAQQMLVQPLFMTTWLIDDFLADNSFFGARQIVLSSASSKTTYSLAHLLKMRQRLRTQAASVLGTRADGQGTLDVAPPRIIGLTSQRNAVFVNALGSYDRVLNYEDLPALDPALATVYVDMAGDSGLRRQVHGHFGDALKYSCSVGATHWDTMTAPGQGEALPGPKPTLFFAPAQIKKRSTEWGGRELQLRMAQAWLDFVPHLNDAMHVMDGAGEGAVQHVYLAMLQGKALADQGHVLSLA